MTSISKASIVFLISIFIQYVFANGFTIDLIHRDSSLSPYYDPSLSRSERLSKAFQRSVSRAASSPFGVQKASAPSGGFESPVRANSGEYLMKLSIGNPPVETLAIADTGSDISWVQCKPCTSCYNQTTPIFDPSDSKTYRNVACQSKPCTEYQSTICTDDNICQYTVTYGDRSSTVGDLATETFTFASPSGQPVSIQKVVFGCGHENEGTFHGSGAGLIGLGGGPLSLVSQLDTLINGKFSYCLVPIDSAETVTSKLKFGSDAVVSGPQAVSTPLTKKEPETFYYLTLESISVGANRLSYIKTDDSDSKASSVEQGNIIIDSGTTLTILPSEFYEELEATLKQSINGKPTDPKGSFSLCFEDPDSIKFPDITFHFTDADVLLKSKNTFIEVEAGLVCLAMVPSTSVAIFGNLSQMDYLVGYDLVAGKVSFEPTDCTKQ
ncbi:hypothetical protein LIER_30135 [Lithospermum erythrorhizon]|uniref:Peptidase A1 domain-containing protein n=1 Tax=Lithospermum erythrorhizon TaxID=34254 RepID=A0AAV3QZQ0_LITER